MTLSPLAPCPACSRHVRINVSACPFCGAAVAISPESVVPAAASISMSRAAVFTFATTLALGCASSPPPPPEPAPTVAPAPTPSPLVTAQPSNNAPSPLMGPQDPGAPVAMYGAPVAIEPMDAGAPAAADAGADVPVVVDAHPTHPAHPTPPAVHPGGPVVRYGSPPRPEE